MVPMIKLAEARGCLLRRPTRLRDTPPAQHRPVTLRRALKGLDDLGPARHEDPQRLQ
jgi:hypothetical protein